MSIVPQSFLEDVWVRKTLGLVGYTCLIYDYLLTLDTEVDFIWCGPWTVTKVIFLFNRYGNIFGQTFIQVIETGWVVNGSHQLCNDFNLFITVFMVVSEESIHILVLLRAWAIWGCRSTVAAALVCSYFIYLFCLLIMIAYGTSSQTFHEFQYLDIIGICAGVMPPFIWILGIASFLLDTMVFGSTMLSLRRHSRECVHLYPSPLLCLLVRDAVMFYIVSVFFDTFNAAIWTVYTSNPKYLLCITLALNWLSIAGQRVVLNLRGLTVRSYTSSSLSAEVNRQIGIIDDAGPEWWRSTSEDSDDLGVPASGRLRNRDNRVMSGDLRMIVLDLNSPRHRLIVDQDAFGKVAP
ncbi:hypothetical protein JVU11DRAFT_6686 [Chiua virens]|nr:hypothetical protein JVU11DRAFT_6686 [Chiua virens]